MNHCTSDLRTVKSKNMTATPRELEVAHLVAHGFSNKEIARKLGITPETVHTHMINILRKFGFRNRAEMWKLFFLLKVN